MFEIGDATWRGSSGAVALRPTAAQAQARGWMIILAPIHSRNRAHVGRRFRVSRQPVQSLYDVSKRLLESALIHILFPVPNGDLQHTESNSQAVSGANPAADNVVEKAGFPAISR